MTNNVVDLWPDIDVDRINEKSPHFILKQQAEILGEKTKGIVEGRVDSLEKEVVEKSEALKNVMGIEEFHFLYGFALRAPALGNYMQPLFLLAYPVQLYPCFIGDVYGALSPTGQVHTVADEQELMGVLREIFSSNKTQKTIQALISQSKE